MSKPVVADNKPIAVQLARACDHTHLGQFSANDLATWRWGMARLSGVAFAGAGVD